jgi:predicted amidophosphoribosyltransferase
MHFLWSFVVWLWQIHGILRARNSFAPPYRCICAECKQPLIQSSVVCAFCKKEMEIIYEHNLECNLDTNDGLIECTLRNPQLKEYCPEVANISFEEYSKNISSTVFNLRRFSQQRLFTLALDNRIINLKRNWLPGTQIYFLF